MDDLISRQDAIEVADAVWAVTGDKNVAKVWDQLKDLPSAQPERKRGQWYEHYSHEDGERDGVQCSECGTHYYFGGQLMNFCPNCGSEMMGGEEDG